VRVSLLNQIFPRALQEWSTAKFCALTAAAGFHQQTLSLFECFLEFLFNLRPDFYFLRDQC